MRQAMMGVDIGTTGCRAVIFQQDGKCLANQSLEYSLYTPQAAWAEQDPEEIFQAFVQVVRGSMAASGLRPDELAGICFSSVMHSIFPVDHTGKPLHNMLIWADSRSQAYTEKLAQEYDAKKLYVKTGCPLHPMYLLSKLLWFREERRPVFAASYKFIGIKEFICYRLFGKFLVDKSIATTTAIYNLETQAWDDEILDILGIDASLLSEVKPTTHVEPGLSAEMAELLGVAAATPVILGAADGILSNLGAGAVNPGQITAMIGTSGAIRIVTDRPQIDERMRTWCYNMTDSHWVVGGAINNGGIALRWVRDKFACMEQYVAERSGYDPYDILSRYAAEEPVGSDGLIMLPFFSGERAPYYNANARGVLFGLNLTHGKRHLVRATMEGVLYSLFSVFRALEEVTGKSNEIRVSGSFTRSPFWVQLMADIFGRVITVLDDPEGAAFGAAVLGYFAMGQMTDIKEVNNLINIKKRYQPDLANHERYQRLVAVYERLYHKLEAEFEEIASIQREWK
ncbi:gluconokinase [Propionispora hippei]|uniref:Gluconate kinase, FGGY family n=1 Tax=Propionispora hippei DSM 15287 TaxID=1123003 RepID=A0A1M6KGZ7_9FIRM|nr:gluconokinase [Propionispora hippei]SHJ58198.1 gluconate kinase, FGGY family [Propionispora hippei DSM 15287]